MTTIELAAELLADNPDLVVLRDGDDLRVEPLVADGFLVQISKHLDGITVFYDGWHEEFDVEETAVECFRMGLTRSTRLRVATAGDFAYRWTAEVLDGDVWTPAGTVGLLFWPFWRRSRTLYLQNDSLPDSILPD